MVIFQFIKVLKVPLFWGPPHTDVRWATAKRSANFFFVFCFSSIILLCHQNCKMTCGRIHLVKQAFITTKTTNLSFLGPDDEPLLFYAPNCPIKCQLRYYSTTCSLLKCGQHASSDATAQTAQHGTHTIQCKLNHTGRHFLAGGAHATARRPTHTRKQQPHATYVATSDESAIIALGCASAASVSRNLFFVVFAASSHFQFSSGMHKPG